MDNEPRQLSTGEIVELFMSCSNNIKKCCDFNIKHWLTKYEELIIEPNFSEAALLIINSASIYSHKVDILETMVLNMDRETNVEQIEQSELNGRVQKKRKKQHLYSKIDPNLNIEYVVESFSTKSLDCLCEKIIIDSGKSTNYSNTTTSTAYTTFLNAISQNYTDRPLLFRHLNKIQANNACRPVFGGQRIMDHNDVNDVDSRWNYRIYVDSIVQSNVVYRIADYERTISRELSRRCKLSANRLSDTNTTLNCSVKPFHLYLPSDELMNIYDFTTVDGDRGDYSNMQRYEQHMERILHLNDDALCALENGKNLNNIICGGLIAFDKQINNCDNSFNNNENSSIDKLKNQSNNCIIVMDQSCGGDKNADLTVLSNLRQSFDEGIGVSGFTSPSCASDMDPVVELIDIFHPINNNIEVDNLEYNLSSKKANKMNILEINYTNTCYDFILFAKIRNTGKRKILLENDPKNGEELKRHKLTKINTDKLMNLGPLSNLEFSDNEFSGFTENDLVNSTAISQNVTFDDDNRNVIENQSIRLGNETNDHNKSSLNQYPMSCSADSGFSDDNDNVDFTNIQIQETTDFNKSITTTSNKTVTNTNNATQHGLQLEHFNMVERIKRWHNILKPVLGHNERHAFCINKVKSDIATFCQNDRNEVTFQDLVRGKRNQYTSRYFLGMLELVNKETIIISHPQSATLCSHDALKIIHKNHSTIT